jgi:hypothetical protein
MNSRRKLPTTPIRQRGLEIDEVRLIADLRIMHGKVDELKQVVSALKLRHDEASIIKYADSPLLAEDIHSVDEIYLWFVRLKERRSNRAAQ